jgi:serine O-acetyltransferase
MKKRFYRLRLAVSALRLLPHFILLRVHPSRALLLEDIEVWAERLSLPCPEGIPRHPYLFATLMTFVREYRNVFYLRCGLVSWLVSWLCPRLGSLDIVCPSIGAGLFIQHGENTFVTAESIGECCWIGRHVVIGYSNETDFPTLGNHVRIFAGAKIVGKVKIGDHATIGLNTVITQDVAPYTTMLGVPGRVVWVGKPEARSAS